MLKLNELAKRYRKSLIQMLELAEMHKTTNLQNIAENEEEIKCLKSLEAQLH